MHALQGSLTFLPYLDLLRILWDRRATGTLIAQRGPDEKRLELEAGAVVSAVSNDPREYLGQLLIAGGHLSEAAFLEAHAAHQETRVPLGRILTMTDAVSTEVVEEVLSIKFRETALGICGWGEGRFSFSLEKGGEARSDLPVSLPLGAILEEAERRQAMGEPLDRRDPEGDPIRSTWAGWFLTPSGGSQERASGADDPLSLAKEALATGASEEAVDRLDVLVAAAPSEEALSLLKTAEARLLTKLRAELLGEPRRPILKLDREAIRAMELTPPERYLLYRLDGRTELEAALKTTPLRQIDGLRLVKRFVREGSLSLDVASGR